MGRRTSRIDISNILPEVDASWLVAATTVDMEDKIKLPRVRLQKYKIGWGKAST